MEQFFRFSALACTLALCLLTGGCGNKGPLFIPEPPPESQPADDSGR